MAWAAFTGFGKNRCIVLFDTRIARRGISEPVAVIAHKMGLYRMSHVPVRTLTGSGRAGVILFLLGIVIFNSKLFEAF
ncbi:MAG: M48 family metalloprotease [Desulfobacterales bacterium]|nr:M48 family metalloprotease [Desulfobacterales bacterium]MDY0377962.1 M48 family metalloprotease [Desulfobacterales bacterium]